jgi:hypothetical protein
MNQAPSLVKSNSSSAVKDNIVVYLCSPKGEIELSPDGRLTRSQLDKIGYKKWRRCEAIGAREIEKISLILSRQLFEQKKKMKVEKHLREKFALDQLKVRCKLRLAQGYSKADEETNAHILKRAQRSEELLYRAIAEEFCPAQRTSSLQMEAQSQSTSKLAHINQKATGLSA